MADDDEQVAQRVRVEGKVQAVGFRANTVEQAEQLGVVGWVSNEPDGSVLAHVEGAPSAVSDLIAWMHSGPHFADVDDVSAEDAEATDADTFDIRH